LRGIRRWEGVGSEEGVLSCAVERVVVDANLGCESEGEKVCGGQEGIAVVLERLLLERTRAVVQVEAVAALEATGLVSDSMV
jgi:hypothetical protein